MPKRERPYDPESRTLTLPDLARVLGISTSHCYRMAAAGELPVPTFRIGGRVLVWRWQVEAAERKGAPHVRRIA